MTDHLGHGTLPNFVERNPARYNQTIREAATYRLLANPVEFSQNMARVFATGLLEEALIHDAPKQIENLRDEFAYLVDQAIERADKAAVESCFTLFNEFFGYALMEARKYGVALGAVMEQHRVGLSGMVDLKHRGLTTGDVSTLKDLQRLRQRHDLEKSSVWEETDLARDEAAAADPGEAA